MSHSDLDIAKIYNKEQLIIACKGIPGGDPNQTYKFYAQLLSDNVVRIGVQEQIIGRDEIGPPMYPEQERLVTRFNVKEIWYSRWEMPNIQEFMKFYDDIKPFVISIVFAY